MIEERLSAAMQACREAVAPSPDFFERLDARALRVDRRRRVRLIVAAAAAAAVLIAGTVVLIAHGDGSSNAAAAHRNFVTEANQICAQAVHQVQAVSPPADAHPSTVSQEQLVAIAERTSVIDQTAIGELRALKPPRADTAAIEAMLTHLDLALGASQVSHAVKFAQSSPTVGGITASPTVQSMAALAVASNAIADAARLARNYGVDRCAEMIYTAV